MITLIQRLRTWLARQANKVFGPDPNADPPDATVEDEQKARFALDLGKWADKREK